MRKYVSAYVICPFYRFEDGEYHQVTVGAISITTISRSRNETYARPVGGTDLSGGA